MSSNFNEMRFAVVASFISLLSTLSGAASAAPASPLGEFLARANLASGAPYRHHLRTHGVDAAGRSVVLDEEGLAFARRRCDRSLCFGIYFNGRRLYDTNYNETALPARSGDPAQLTYQTIVSYAFTDPSFRSSGGRLAERESATAAGRVLRRLIVVPRDGIAMEVSLDVATALIAGASSIDGAYRFVFHDQRSIGEGLTVPFGVDLNDKPFDRFDRREVVAERLEPPAGLVPSFAANAGTTEMLRGDRPVVACTIGAFTVPCLLDTGNSGMAMSLELAEALGLEPMEAAAEVRGVGSYLTGVAKAPPLTVAGATLPSALYTVLHDIHGYGYDVVLGADAFARARVTIDYPKRRVTIAPPNDFADRHPLALAFESFSPVIDVQLADLDVRLMIDTGDDSSINLADDYYALHRTLFKPTGKTRIGGAGGTVEQITGEIQSVRIAGFTVAHQKIDAQRQSARIADGHVGSGFLAHFAVVFDYAHRRVALEPRTGDASIKSEL
jgi:hypothetical protein